MHSVTFLLLNQKTFPTFFSTTKSLFPLRQPAKCPLNYNTQNFSHSRSALVVMASRDVRLSKSNVKWIRVMIKQRHCHEKY